MQVGAAPHLRAQVTPQPWPDWVTTPSPSRYTRAVAAILIGCLALGLVYAFVVPAGLPYDEPSHWATVLYYARHWTLPVLGHRGVSYEAQMGPVAYYFDAVVVHVVTGLGGSQSAALHAVRVLGALELVGCAALLARILRLCRLPQSGLLAALVVFAWNPMFLAMSSSVQNDSLALLIGFLAVERALTWREGVSPAEASALGALAGLAVLTKLTMWPVVAVTAGWLLWRSGWWRAALFGVASAVVCGWWFVRNQVVYGDVTARTAVNRTSTHFGAYHVHGASGVGHVVEDALAYLWLPTEYLRNTIVAPDALKVALLVLSLAALAVGAARLRTTRPSAMALLLGLGAVSAVAWLVTYLSVQALAPRTAYLALPAWLLLVGLATQVVGRWRVIISLVVMLLLNVWVVHAVSGVHVQSFLTLSHA